MDKIRHDGVLINMNDATIFCELISSFVYVYDEQPYALALVKPLDAAIGSQRLVERDLGQCRLQARRSGPEQHTIFPARSIRRGGLIYQEPKKPGEYTVLDTIDGDMFLRLIQLFPNRQMAAQR